MKRLMARTDRWFSKPAPPERLATFRVLLGTFTLAYLLIRLPVFLSLADGRPSRFDPVGVLTLLAEPLPGLLVRFLVFSAVVSALAFTIGWRYRVSGPTLIVSMLLLTTYRSSWGQLLHFENLMVLHICVVGLSPAAGTWSIDARRRTDKRPASSRYGFPLQLAATITVTTYLLAGLAKLRYGGVDWMFGDTLRNHVAYSATRLELLGGRASPLAGPAVSQGWLFPPLATATVIIELLAPFALVSDRFRRWWVIAVWLMHVGILGLMFIVFPYPLFGLAFVPMYNVERFGRAAVTASRRLLFHRRVNCSAFDVESPR